MGLIKTAIMTGGGMYAVNRLTKSVLPSPYFLLLIPLTILRTEQRSTIVNTPATHRRAPPIGDNSILPTRAAKPPTLNTSIITRRTVPRRAASSGSRTARCRQQEPWKIIQQTHAISSRVKARHHRQATTKQACQRHRNMTVATPVSPLHST
jgi:hypothetical protein